MFWAYGSYVGGRVLVLISVAILARLLTPSDFGLVGFALIVTTALDAISDLGVSQALIVVDDDDDVNDQASTAWTVGVALGVGLALLSTALAPLAASFFDAPELELMLPLLGLNFILRALGITHFALAQKQMDFRTRTIAQLADVVVRGGLGIALALAGAGAYSLVFGYLAGSAAMTVSLWLLVRWRPQPQIRRQHLGRLLRFGGGLTFLGIITFVDSNVDYLLIGKVLGETELGLYTLAFRLPQLVILNIAIVAGLVLFPAFAEIGRNAIAGAYLTALRYVMIACTPLAVTFFVLAEPLILIAFGPQWVDAIPAMRILSLYAFALTIGMPAGNAYKAIERVDVLIKLAIPHALVLVGLILVFVDQGITAVAACMASAAAALTAASLIVAGRILKAGYRQMFSAAWPALVAGIAMYAIMAPLTVAIDDPYLQLVVALPLGGMGYLGALWLIAPEVLKRLWRTAVGGRGKRSMDADEQLAKEGTGT